jgi:hypothetical protein
MSVAKAMHTTVGVREEDGKVASVDLEDCLLQTVTGCCTLVVSTVAASHLLDSGYTHHRGVPEMDLVSRVVTS